jgi:hypothetical protein
MNINKIGIFGLVALSLLCLSVTGADNLSDRMPEDLDCRQCHDCDEPTIAEPCFKPCPKGSWAQQASKHSFAEAPDSMLLDKLVHEYSAVHFNHKVHADMSDMGKGCATCHHYSPPGRIPACGECHTKGATANLSQPTLKGAYHRQCLSCHREWSHDTQCFVCHYPVNGSSLENLNHDPTDIMGKSHPLIHVPNKKIYYTPHKAGPTVTFYHQEHIDLFGLRCVNCHSQENCGYCHDIEKPFRPAKSQEEVHAVCSNCHSTDKCDKCHSSKEKPAFTHASTGWPLNRYHDDLACRACHPTGKQIAKLRPECSACHKWTRETFSHEVTGLQLDEIHLEMECADCHSGGKYSVPPDCSSCHDDNRSHKSRPPGKFIKVASR